MGNRSLAGNLSGKLKSESDQARSQVLSRFFKTGKGQYGEGDKFLGLTVPQVRCLIRDYQNMDISDLNNLINSPYHEQRLAALLIAVGIYGKSGAETRTSIFKWYLKNTKFINNWDLVDLSAPNIVGFYVFSNRKQSVLSELAKSKKLWERRISILACFYDIRNGNYRTAFKISEILIGDSQDLIHKAVGWMLREVGKNCGEKTLEIFLNKWSAKMPRTMLRYAIEKFNKDKRQHYLKSGR